MVNFPSHWEANKRIASSLKSETLTATPTVHLWVRLFHGQSGPIGQIQKHGVVAVAVPHLPTSLAS